MSILLKAIIPLCSLAQESKLDSTIAFTPNVSSVTIPYGQSEITNFSSLLSRTHYRDINGDPVAINGREAFFNNLTQLTYGVTPSGKLNIGIDLITRFRSIGGVDATAFDVFTEPPGILVQRAVTAVGPRIRFSPFNSSFTIQSALWFPTGSDLETRQFLGQDRTTWATQLMYGRFINQNILLFGQVDVLYQFSSEDTPDSAITLPLTFYLGYYLPNKWFFFGYLNHASTFTEALDTNPRSQQFGLGIQHQFSGQFLLNTFYNRYFGSVNGGGWSGINLGLRYLLF